MNYTFWFKTMHLKMSSGKWRPFFKPLCVKESVQIVLRCIFLLQLCWLMWHMYVLSRHLGLLTHWGRDKLAAFPQTTFSNTFSLMKMFELREQFHWSLFLRVQLTIFKHCRGTDKMATFSQTTFSIHVLRWICLNSGNNFIEVCS